MQSTLSARLASWSQRVSVGKQRHSSWARTISKTRARSTAAFTVAFGRTTTRQRCRSSQRKLCGKRTTHQATTVRPRGTGRKQTFITPSLVGLQSLQTWGRWTTASGRPRSPRFQRSVFRRKLLSKAAIACAFAVFAASDVPDKAVSAKEATSMHDCLQMLHSNPNHFQQRNTRHDTTRHDMA